MIPQEWKSSWNCWNSKLLQLRWLDTLLLPWESKDGNLLPYMLIFQGKTAKSIPDDVVPAAGSIYTSTAKHVATSITTLKYVKDIVIPSELSESESRESRPNIFN